MNSEDIYHVVDAIPEGQWEEAISIGKYKRCDIRKIIDRPYSNVANLNVIGSAASAQVYIKSYKNPKNLSQKTITELVARDYQTLVRFHDQFANSSQFGVVKPLFVIPEKWVLATEEVPGKSLQEIIAQKGSFFPPPNKISYLSECMKNVGAWLTFFQSLDSFQNEEFSVDELIDFIEERLKMLSEDRRRRFPVSYQSRVLDFLNENKRNIEDHELQIRLSHNDFNLGNIVIDSDKITVLDFGKTNKGSCLLDISRIYHQLLLMTFKPQYKISVIKKLQKALLEGFGMPTADELMMFRFLLIRHTITHLIGITRFWQKDLRERIYNYWVLYRELRLLDSLLGRKKGWLT